MIEIDIGKYKLPMLTALCFDLGTEQSSILEDLGRLLNCMLSSCHNTA